MPAILFPAESGEIKRREASWTLTKKLDASAGPGEIKRREMVLDPQVSPEEIKSRKVELRVGLLLIQLFPNGRATDIVFVTLFCIAVGTAVAWCGGRCAMPDGHCRNILLFWRRSTAALVFRVGVCFEVSLFCPPFSHSSPSLIGLLASVDGVKQQKSSSAGSS